MRCNIQDIPNISTLFGWFVFLVYVELYVMCNSAQVIVTIKRLFIRAVDKLCLKLLYANQILLGEFCA